uniref:Uncharacterized protein n=1 Tax=Anopheles quadriannulatus TaxID=34691 RepID=A0A182WVA6_ANOQN
MIHLLNFIAGMNNTLDCKCENGEPREQLAMSENSTEHMDPHCVTCCNTTDYSVKTLRKMFLLNHLEGPADAQANPAASNIEKLPICTCREHTVERKEKKCSEEKLCETRSVQELRQLYEAKVKSLEQESSNGSIGRYSRPVTARTDDRQDTISMDLPHPEGQMFMYTEPPIRSKPCTRWNVINASIVEVPNGMQITFTVIDENKH